MNYEQLQMLRDHLSEGSCATASIEQQAPVVPEGYAIVPTELLGDAALAIELWVSFGLASSASKVGGKTANRIAEKLRGYAAPNPTPSNSGELKQDALQQLTDQAQEMGKRNGASLDMETGNG